MKPPLPHTLSAVPQTLHARLEIAKAIRTLAGPDEDELLRQRRAEIAAIRRDLEVLTRDIRKAGEEWLVLAKAELRAALKKYSPDQPRVPAGNPDGGQWTPEPEGAGGSVDDISSFSNGGGSADGASQSNIPNVQLAAGGDLRCEGFAGGCQSGGSYGATAMYSVSGHALCMDCAVKVLGIQNEPSKEKVLTLSPYLLRR
jgi:hypothetical protein